MSRLQLSASHSLSMQGKRQYHFLAVRFWHVILILSVTIFIAPCFLLKPVGPYPGNRAEKYLDLKLYCTRICLSMRNFCLFFHADFPMASAALPALIFPQLSLSLFEPIGSLTWDRLEQILEASSYCRHLLGCPCCILTVWAVCVHFGFKACWIPLQSHWSIPREQLLVSKNIQSLSFEMHSRSPS